MIAMHALSLPRAAGAFILAVLLGGGLAGPSASSGATADRIIRVASIRGTINPASSDYLKTAIQAAQAEEAQALVLELDTPGGLVSSVREMAQAVDQSSVPVIVHVVPAGAAATSAGALLMFASHLAAMAPGTNLGAAHPVGAQGEDIPGSAGQKAASDVAAFARGLAELRGRPVELAEQVVLKSRSFTAEEARAHKLVELVAPSREDLFRQLQGREIRVRNGEKRTIRSEGSAIRIAEMTAGQKLLHLLAHPNVAALLMTLGLVLLYIEVSSPGVTLPGILGGICLITAFVALQLLPIRTGGLILMLLGLLLLAAEGFVTSGGALGAGGVVSFVLGMIWLVDPASTDLRVSTLVWLPVGITLGSTLLVVSVATSRMSKLSRATLERIGGGSLSGLSGYPGLVESVDASGLRGKASIRGELWDFRSLAPVAPGDQVQATAVEGFSVVVRKRET